MNNKAPESSLVGCCGWPEGKLKYFAHYPVVELQSTFYDLPSVLLAVKWKALAPPDFEFCMKAWQLITHTPASPTYRKLKTPIAPSEVEEFGSFRPTEQVFLAWERTVGIARALKATVVVLQCPPSFLPMPENVRNLETFLTNIGPQAFRLAWEPRGEWPPGLIREICVQFDLIHCVDPFQSQPVSLGPSYWRLHGIGGYRYRYSAADLEHLERMRTAAQQESRTPVYIMFNNIWMKDDSQRFLSM